MKISNSSSDFLNSNNLSEFIIIILKSSLNRFVQIQPWIIYFNFQNSKIFTVSAVVKFEGTGIKKHLMILHSYI